MEVEVVCGSKPRNTQAGGSPQEPGEASEGSSLGGPPEEPTLIPDFWPPDLGGNACLFFEASQFVIGYDGPRKCLFAQVPIGSLAVLPGIFKLCSLFAQEIPRRSIYFLEIVGAMQRYTCQGLPHSFVQNGEKLGKE